MTVALVRNLVFVARFTAVDVAHELRRDYERGVFSSADLARIGGSVAVGLFAIGGRAWMLALLAATFAAFFTWAPARADRRWRDDWREL